MSFFTTRWHFSLFRFFYYSVQIEVKELVEIIHTAAADTECVALHGTFGQGHGFEAGGFAHVEEIRNAIRVFNESHRVHAEPNLMHDPNLPLPKDGIPKASYAFADTFAHPTDTGNKEYYLASAFKHVSLQSRGELNLMGLGVSTPFLRSALDKYGVKAHVFKHGKYKNAPNSLTETGYTKEHMQNTKSMVTSINDHSCMEIVRSRSLPATFDEHMWKAINKYGTLTAQNAQELGLVDSSPPINPLNALLKGNKGETEMAAVKKWSNELDFDNFHAKESISLTTYAQLLSRRKKAEERKWKVHSMMSYLSEKSTATQHILSALGYKPPFYNISQEDFSNKKGKLAREKIAVVHISGGINHVTAQRFTSCLQQIKKDKNTKCVILRVDSPGGSAVSSEAILEECKDTDKPIICSMSNAAASGGYYIATACDKIFALPNSITGSIGVYGIKFDATGLAAQYGVNVQHIATGPVSSTYSPFQPLTRKMQDNLSRNVDRVYDYFKEIVSSGRHLSPEETEAIAQGRVWTGEQALQVGLVDYLGGLDRAVLFAKKNYTSGEPDIEVWPKQPTLKDMILGTNKMNVEDDNIWSNIMAMKDFIAHLCYEQNEFAQQDGEGDAYQCKMHRNYNPNNLLSPPSVEIISSLLMGKAAYGPMTGIMLTATEADALTLGVQEESPQNGHIARSLPLGYQF